MRRLSLVVFGFLLGAALGGSWLYGQPALYPSAGTDLVTGQGTNNRITKWTGQRSIGNGSLNDTATQKNQSVCFDNNGVLDCGGTLTWNPATQTLGGSSGTVINIIINALTNVAGISGTATKAKNLRGSCTFANAAGSCAVTFPTAESDASYYITTACNVNKAFWLTSQTSSGFVLNESAAGTGTDKCSWHLLR